jgi:xylan 1,4-beta-xylosidase
VGGVGGAQRAGTEEKVTDMPGVITNPILPGFNPDPSICRAGEDYYIATSTFEWYPGVQIHHSRDLINWSLVTRPLSRASQLDMRGNPDSCGVWAPCLSFADGKFWLVYTDVKRFDGNFKDAHNYIVTAPSIEGPWSDPVYVNSSGFDPTLFHDDDGRKWFANMVWNHRASGIKGGPKETLFGGILLQEWDVKAGKLFGPVTNIYHGSQLGLVEGPHLFKRDGWYYLTTAEGGTGYDHAVTMARSRKIEGPYETHPNLHLLTSRFDAAAPLPRAGHGQMVETPDGEIYHTHLCARPLPGIKKSVLGRETGIQKCVWREDGWLYLADGGLVPSVDVQAPALAKNVVRKKPAAIRRDFDDTALPPEFQWLRTPVPERLFSLSERPGHLRLHGRESIGSWFEQSLVARRAEQHSFRAECKLDFEPQTFQQAAGITFYYSRAKFHFFAVTHDEDAGRILTLMSCNGDAIDGKLTFPLPVSIPLPEGPLELAADIDGAVLRFLYRQGGEWKQAGGALDASTVSDEGGSRGEHGSFTGAFIGMMAFDITGQARHADFDWFSHTPR